MEANELMIGDWVQNTCGHKGKVIGFRYYPDTKSNDIVISYHGNDTTWSLSFLIEPIPLTEEILKANDWEIMRGSISMTRCLYRISNKERIRIYLHSPYMFQCIDDERCEGYEVREWSIGNIRYIHELQHALRLCGLNDLADNFKIE